MNQLIQFIEKNSFYPSNIDPVSYQEINYHCSDCKKNNPKYECKICNLFWCQNHSCQHLKNQKDSENIIEILDNCPICLTGYSEKSSYQLMPCKHRFHFECIRKWLFLNDDCPYCREITENNPHKCEESEFKRYQVEYLDLFMDFLQF